ncbi:MAG: hypothetical protein AAF663_00780 [Planctomycetota bacterium]
MAKRKAKYAETEGLFDRLTFGDPAQELTTVILLIPSHEKNERPVANQGEVIKAGLELLADLFDGATQLEARSGIFKHQNQYLVDRPMLLESYASIEKLKDYGTLDQLVGFAKQVGRDLNQAAVAIVLDDQMHLIEKYADAPKKKLI